jgi:hypothetical protein
MLGATTDVDRASAEPMKIGVSERLVSGRGWRIWPPTADALCMHENPPGGGNAPGDIFGK